VSDATCVVDGQTLQFSCDTERHRVIATSVRGDIRWGFGRRGTGAGAFETPLDVTLVRPEFGGEDLTACGREAAWLAVADYGNRRVQVFEIDGTWVGTIDGEDAGLAGPPWALHWSAPFLEIEVVEGPRTRIHLSAALLRASAGAAGMPCLIRALRSR
jgi:hypothetical protein